MSTRALLLLPLIFLFSDGSAFATKEWSGVSPGYKDRLAKTVDVGKYVLTNTEFSKDGIRPIDNPMKVSVSDAGKFLGPGDVVIGMVIDGAKYAIPRKVIEHHQALNFEVNFKPYTLTYDPLTAATIGFIGYEFGYSGKLLESNLVLYERETGSLMPQVLGEGINKKYEGKVFEKFYPVKTKWKNWKNKYPDTVVFLPLGGFRNLYNSNPYEGYDLWGGTIYPIKNKDKKHPFFPKEIMVALELDGKPVAFPKKAAVSAGEIDATINGISMKIKNDPSLDVIEVYVKDKLVPSIEIYWFAWYAQRPDTAVLAEGSLELEVDF